MPDQAFAGQLVGGVSFVRSTTSNTASEIPVILQNDTTPVKPVLKVGKASLNDLSADRVLGVTLSNKANTLVKDATVTTGVTDKNDKVVYEKMATSISRHNQVLHSTLRRTLSQSRLAHIRCT